MDIEVKPGGKGDYEVTVRDGATETRHRVKTDRGAGTVEAAFRILRTFDLSVISTYFPEFERELPKYM